MKYEHLGKRRNTNPDDAPTERPIHELGTVPHAPHIFPPLMKKEKMQREDEEHPISVPARNLPVPSQIVQK